MLSEVRLSTTGCDVKEFDLRHCLSTEDLIGIARELASVASPAPLPGLPFFISKNGVRNLDNSFFISFPDMGMDGLKEIDDVGSDLLEELREEGKDVELLKSLIFADLETPLLNPRPFVGSTASYLRKDSYVPRPLQAELKACWRKQIEEFKNKF